MGVSRKDMLFSLVTDDSGSRSTSLPCEQSIILARKRLSVERVFHVVRAL